MIHPRGKYIVVFVLYEILFEWFSFQINTSTPTTAAARRSGNKKSLTSELITPSPRVIRRSGTHPIEESNSSRSIKKRKHSMSPISHAPIIIKKRTKNDSLVKKTHSKRKEKKTEEEESEDEDADTQQKSTVNKRKLNLDLSSKS